MSTSTKGSIEGGRRLGKEGGREGGGRERGRRERRERREREEREREEGGRFTLLAHML